MGIESNPAGETKKDPKSGFGKTLKKYWPLFFTTTHDYKFTIAIMLVLGLVGASMRLFCLKSLSKDVARISKILEDRVTELSKQNSS